METKVEIQQEVCCNPGCGISFWIEKGYQERLVKTKTRFHCPNGHGMSYTGDTDEQRLKKEILAKYEMQRLKDAEIARLEKALRRKCRKKKS